MPRISAAAHVAIDASQFPDQVRHDLLESLRTRKIAHKFHYDSVKQTQKWLALHQQYSPSRNDDDCRAIYQESFETATEMAGSKNIHVIGLGCGGGQKDSRLIQALKRRTKKIFYTPSDVATAMVLTARQTALTVLDESRIFPLVCDLKTATDLPSAVDLPNGHHAQRIVTFFGMIPNFEPKEILPKLASLIQPKDILLFSANLAPGDDYAAGVKRIFPQYDNEPTRDWLLTFLTDLGIGKNDGKLQFAIETDQSGLKRVVAHFRFNRTRKIKIDEDEFIFKAAEKVRLFYSYRYTPSRVRQVLSEHGLRIGSYWVTKSGEEGVFLCSLAR